MIEMPSKLRMTDLRDAIKGLRFKLDDTGVFMAFPQSCKIGRDLDHRILAAAHEIETFISKRAVYLCVNVLPPKIYVPAHMDTLERPRMSRWHLPIATNLYCRYQSEVNGNLHMTLGTWCGPITYWEPHTVYNNGCEHRIHLIVDLE